MSRPVIVSPYDPAWSALFDAEAGFLRDLLGSNLVALHHIGSTAVPGLAAKPIIDILPVVRGLAPVDALTPQFTAAGYTARGEYGIAGRRLFGKGTEQVHTHHVHVFAVGSPHILRHLALRDYLRVQPEERDAYAALKIALARQHPQDIGAYINGKDSFVRALEARALAWWDTQRAGWFLRAPRLDLIALSDEQLSCLLQQPARLEAEFNLILPEDFPDAPARHAIAIKIEKMAQAPFEQHPWFTYWLMALRDQGQGVGLVGFKGSPDAAGSVEIGYGIHPYFGRRGLMTEAVQALVGWAFSHPQCRAVTACGVLPSNPASQRVLEKSGFSRSHETSQGLDFQIERPR